MTETFVRVHPTESVVHHTSTRLRATGYAALANVDCEAVGGDVVLHGVVPTYYLKQLAQTIARDHPDVTSVQNRLQVSSRRFDVPTSPDHAMS